MVFKLRDKSLFWTRAGWKNNWHPKCFNVPRPANSEYTLGVRCRYDHHSFLRLTQSYRNFSRLCRQYFYGDKRLEQVFIMELRTAFKVPLVSECLTDQIKHGGQRRMVDQLDRDYELCSYNQHPFQIHTYQLHNKYLQKINEDYKTISQGQKTIDQIFEAEVLKAITEQKEKLPAGQNLTLQRTSEIILRVARYFRNTIGSTGFKTPTGQFNDYLQQRRPFSSPDPSRVGY